MKKIMDGNEAASRVSYLFTEVAGIYPITPSSPMAEHLDEWSNEGKLNLFGDRVKVVEMQSEAGAAGMVHGSLQAGCLTSTYTASQGLLLMLPNMYKMAGEMLPCVMHVAARSLSTHALSIFGDHQDIYASRMTGFCMLASSSVQDAYYLSGISHLSSVVCELPFMHFFDGFRTSHELSKINVLNDTDWEALFDNEALSRFRSRAINPKKPYTIGTAQNDDIYFQATEVRNIYYDAVPDIVQSYMSKLNALAGTDYKPFNYYGSRSADKVIIAMGSVCETIKETIDYLNINGYNVGLVEVHLYRPFSDAYLKKVIPGSVKNIAVLDRTKEPGSNGEPLYLDIVRALKQFDIRIVGGRYGLSSKNTTPSQIKAVYDMLESPVTNFTIGINDDVTNLSLKVDDNFKLSNSDEFIIYGYGSDGMVSASKSIITLAGDYSDNYVQGYFQYDSKKSGGVTKCHLRFSDKKIRSAYYVENPKLVVVTKDSYLKQFDCISNIKENGMFILNTVYTKDEVISNLSDDIKRVIKDRNIKFYIINAYELARKVGLKNKISTIMESVILYLSNIVSMDFALKEMEVWVKENFSRKGEDIVKANLDAITKAKDYLEEVIIPSAEYNVGSPNKYNNVFEAMEKKEGDALAVSAFLSKPGGTFESGTSSLEKRGISDIIPKWVSENCIQCNQCSFVCPHGVIRPYILSKSEYDKAPDYVQNRCIKPIGKDMDDYYYLIAISINDCTGCMVCVNTCPGMKDLKALISEEIDSEKRNKEQLIFDYVNENIKDKGLVSNNTVKGCQFKEPKFVFSGACAGCGETAYIKLLTQLFGESLVIANATGCSSIYGGSAPVTPYTVPWASSLFEDNAEYGYGIKVATDTIRGRIAKYFSSHVSENPLYQEWLDDPDNYEITNKVYNDLKDSLPRELKPYKEYIPSRTVWMIGGDGWAYDIGFGGIDHVLASSDNVNILVLDSQVYSNTGGQSSKASPKGSIAAFTSSGKTNVKKDLARMALSYPHVYVAQVSLGANMAQLLKVMNEAANYNGPSIIIAYTPCIAHGIKDGLENSVYMEKLATISGYYPIFHYNPLQSKFYLDSKKVDFDLYEEFLDSQTRYSMLKKVNPEKGKQLLEESKMEDIKRFEYYKKLDESSLSNEV